MEYKVFEIVTDEGDTEFRILRKSDGKAVFTSLNAKHAKEVCFLLNEGYDIEGAMADVLGG